MITCLSAASQLPSRHAPRGYRHRVVRPGLQRRPVAAVRERRDQRLVDVFRATLRVGGELRMRTLWRHLELAGLAAALKPTVLSALWAVARELGAADAHLSRAGERRKGPRIVVGVHLVHDGRALRAAVADRWESLLDAEGLPAEVAPVPMEFTIGPQGATHFGRLDGLIRAAQQRREDAEAYFALAAAYLHRSHRSGWNHYLPGDREIWRRHCEGETLEEISAATGRPESTVQGRIDFHRARAGLARRDGR